jgi:membrane fusion protein
LLCTQLCGDIIGNTHPARQPKKRILTTSKRNLQLSDLFRSDAVKHATSRLNGEVVVMASLSSRLLAGLALAVVVIGLIFAATASYARKETVGGWLAPQSGMIRVVARQGGVVSQIHVREGQVVEAGTPIATLSLSSELADGDSFVALSNSVSAQRNAAQSRASAAHATLDAEQRQLVGRRAALSRELVEARHSLSLQVERVKLARAEVERAETVAAQGFLPRRELEARRSAELAAEQESSSLASQVLGYERQIGEVDARLLAIPIDLQAARAEAASVDADLIQQGIQVETQGRYVVVATVTGRIAALPFDTGQTVVAGTAVAILTAGDTALQGDLYAPSRAAGFIKPGQEVRLMYQAFPYQKFGAGRGIVDSVSRTVLAPSEVAIPGLQVQEPVFRVRVKLERDTVSAYGQDVPLQPGMLVNADIVMDRRSLLEWLLDPLYAAGRRG